MPRKTDGEKIDELQKLVNALDTRVATLSERLDNVRGDVVKLERDMEKNEQKLEKSLEEVSRKLWYFVAAVFTAMFGLLLNNLFKK